MTYQWASGGTEAGAFRPGDAINTAAESVSHWGHCDIVKI